MGRRISANVTIELQDRHPTPHGDMNCADNYDVAPLDAMWPDSPLFKPVVARTRARLKSLEKRIYTPPDMVGELGNSNWVAFARLVANLNLTLEFFTAGPANADVRCQHVPEWCELLCVTKTLAPTSSRGFKGQTESPVYALKKNRHLQHCLFNVMPLIGVRGPHCLGDHSASVYDSTVEETRRRVERLLWSVSTNRTNKEEMTFSVGIGRCFDRWNRVALQQVEEILLSSTRL